MIEAAAVSDSRDDRARRSQGLHGHLELICGVDDNGRSSLRHQSFRAPVHLSKPHFEEGMLVVNVVNPTAGLLAGDRIEYRVTVESGGRLLLTTPSATRIHRMREGRAEVRQEFHVESGAWLEIWPELVIPQAGALYRQETEIRVMPGGELLFCESLAPGRVASGESFAFAELEWATDLFVGDIRVARERYALNPRNGSLAPMLASFPTGYCATVFVASPRLSHSGEYWRRLHDLHHTDAWVGVSALGHGAFVVKMIAADSLELRRSLAAIRAELYSALDVKVEFCRGKRVKTG